MSLKPYFDIIRLEGSLKYNLTEDQWKVVDDTDVFPMDDGRCELLFHLCFYTLYKRSCLGYLIY
jgi:hypothetical protein